jgi:hypothetical protein
MSERRFGGGRAQFGGLRRRLGVIELPDLLRDAPVDVGDLPLGGDQRGMKRAVAAAQPGPIGFQPLALVAKLPHCGEYHGRIGPDCGRRLDDIGFRGGKLPVKVSNQRPGRRRSGAGLAHQHALLLDRSTDAPEIGA